MNYGNFSRDGPINILRRSLWGLTWLDYREGVNDFCNNCLASPRANITPSKPSIGDNYTPPTELYVFQPCKFHKLCRQCFMQSRYMSTLRKAPIHENCPVKDEDIVSPFPVIVKINDVTQWDFTPVSGIFCNNCHAEAGGHIMETPLDSVQGEIAIFRPCYFHTLCQRCLRNEKFEAALKNTPPHYCPINYAEELTPEYKHF